MIHEQPQRPAWDRIIREHEEKTLTGVSRVSRWRWERAGCWPKSVRLGPNSRGHWLSEILAALESRSANDATA